MPKVWNMRDPNLPVGHIYVGRPSPWGNPFEIGKDGTRTEVIELFKQRALQTPEFVAEVRSKLRGQDLACWCAPAACHADFLLELANE